jgi:hypothetical protein
MKAGLPYSFVATVATVATVAVIVTLGGLWILGPNDRLPPDHDARLATAIRDIATLADEAAERGALVDEKLASIETRLTQLEIALARQRADETSGDADGSGSATERSASGTDPLIARIDELTERLEQIEGHPFLAGNAAPPDGLVKGIEQERASFSPDRLIGEPDTPEPGDHGTAWASAQPNGGEEWIEVYFDPPVVADGVVIVESFNPGAVARVEVARDTTLRQVWSGHAPSTEPLRHFIVEFRTQTVAAVRIWLDTTRVEGWNEIDAVGLVTHSGTQWATGASASSTYASSYGDAGLEPTDRL